MRFELLPSRDAQVVHVGAFGHLSMMDLAAGERQPMAALIGAGWETKRIAIDLQGADSMNSSGIGWLVDTGNKVRAGGGSLAVHSAPPLIRQIFQMMKLHSIVPLKANEAEAIAYLSGGAQ